eukprot:4461181-Prymnesium_polylepis.1
MLRRFLASPRTAASIASAASAFAVAGALSQCSGTDINYDARFDARAALSATGSAAAATVPRPPAAASAPGVDTGEISTHVISKLGKASCDGAAVRVSYHADYAAGALSPGWVGVCERGERTTGRDIRVERG